MLQELVSNKSLVALRQEARLIVMAQQLAVLERHRVGEELLMRI